MMKLQFRGINEDGKIEYSNDLGLERFFEAYDDGLLDGVEQYINRKWVKVE